MKSKTKKETASESKNSSAHFLKIHDLLSDFFGSNRKASEWLFTKNTLFGGVCPDALIESGKYEKVLRVVEFMISENERE